MQLEKLATRIEELCSSRNVKVTRMLLDCGLTKNVLDNIRKGSFPSIDKILAIAQYFNVNIEYLIGETEQRRKLKVTPMSPAQALYLVTKTKLGAYEAKTLFKIANIDLESFEPKVNDEQLYWVSFHLFIPQEILKEFIQTGDSDNYSQLNEITETDYVKSLPFDTHLVLAPWWDGDAESSKLSKEMYECRSSFSNSERKWIEYEYEYMKQKFNQVEAYEWVANVEKQKTLEPNYREKGNEYVTCSQDELSSIYNQMLILSNRVRSLGTEKKQITMSSAARENDKVKANMQAVKELLESAPVSTEDI